MTAHEQARHARDGGASVSASRSALLGSDPTTFDWTRAVSLEVCGGSYDERSPRCPTRPHDPLPDPQNLGDTGKNRLSDQYRGVRRGEDHAAPTRRAEK